MSLKVRAQNLFINLVKFIVGLVATVFFTAWVTLMSFVSIFNTSTSTNLTWFWDWEWSWNDK